MTIDEFIKRLEKTPRRWHVLPDGRLRLQRRYCPITAVHGMKAAKDWRMCLPMLEMSEGDGLAIVDASDDPFPTQLRKRILAACGLEEYHDH